MNKREIKALVSRMTKIMNDISIKRDQLRDLRIEIADVEESLDEGLLDLESAIDTFSKYL